MTTDTVPKETPTEQTTDDTNIIVSAKWSAESNSWIIINHEAIRQEEKKRKKK